MVPYLEFSLLFENFQAGFDRLRLSGHFIRLILTDSSVPWAKLRPYRDQMSDGYKSAVLCPAFHQMNFLFRRQSRKNE